ncbi:MAG: thioesterase family protein [Hyphomicrobiales bacterium]
MIGPIETVRDTANSWECDENDHINVQFYAARFDVAVRGFLVEAGWQVPHRVMRLIRYHAELRGGEPVHGTTGMVSLDDGRIALEHRLYASQREGMPLTATALDVLPDVAREDLSAFDVPAASGDALPKSGAISAEPLVVPQELLEHPGLTTTYRGVVPPDAFGPEAESSNGPMLLDRYLVGTISDSATHSWAYAGADDSWLRARNWGRAAVQLQLVYGLRPMAGDVLIIRSCIAGFSTKTVSYRHHLVNAMNGSVIAIADITSLMLNLQTRRAESWPADKVAHLEACVAAYAD